MTLFHAEIDKTEKRNFISMYMSSIIKFGKIIRQNI